MQSFHNHPVSQRVFADEVLYMYSNRCIVNTPTVFVKPKTQPKKHSHKIIGDSSNVNQLNPCVLLIQRSYPEIESSDKTVKFKVYDIANI